DGTAAIRVATLIGAVNINDSSYNRVDGNLISGNGVLGQARGGGGVGIFITQFYGTAQYNTVTNNQIGTSADGTTPLPNGSGMFIGGGTQHNTVEGNLISGNMWEGVTIFADFLPQPTPTSDNVIRHNTITNNSDGVQIGGTGPGQTNLIHDNGGAGILFRNLGFDFNLYPGQDFYTANSPDSPTATSIVPVTANAVSGNAIVNNTGPDIDVSAAAAGNT